MYVLNIFISLNILTECPVCREPFTHDNLIENVFIRKSKVAAIEETQGEEQTCTGCESNPSTSYCLQCDDWLCGDCVNAHKRVRMTKDHQLTSKEEAMANNKGQGKLVLEIATPITSNAYIFWLLDSISSSADTTQKDI